MTLGFATPALLWGLLAALAPIVIHLINRRRARLMPFPTLVFVKQSQQRLARALKLKQLLLVLLRVLAIATLVLWLAGPRLEAEALPEAKGPARQGATAWVVVVDTSLSMRAVYEGKPLMQRAKDHLKTWLQELPENDAVAILGAPSLPGEVGGELSLQRLNAFKKLDILNAGFGRTDFSQALEHARVLLEAAPQPNKRLLVAGTFKAQGYDADFSLGGLAGLGVETYDARQGAPIPNNAILALSAERSFQTGPTDWRVDLRVARYGGPTLSDVPISLAAEGRPLADGFVDLPEHGEVTKSFIVAFDDADARLTLQARLKADALAEDDVRLGVVELSRHVRALLVDGAPSSIRHEDEVFYLREALDPGGLGRSRIAVAVQTPDAFTPQSLLGADVVFLCQVPRLTPELGAALRGFVEKGGALVVSAGPHLDAESYNAAIPDLLPGALRVVHTAGNPTDTSSGASPVFLTSLDTTHPAFRVFTKETAHSLTIAPVRAYLTYDPDATRQKRVLAEFSDGSPALVETAYGQGRAVFFASSLSRAWNELPIEPGYLPLLQELTHSLMRRGQDEDQAAPEATVGEPVRFPIKAPWRELASPSGARLSLDRDAQNQNLTSAALPEIGIYQARAGSRSLAFAANAPTSESDLTPRQGKADQSGSLAQHDTSPENQGQDLAGLAVFMLLAWLLAESLLILRF